MSYTDLEQMYDHAESLLDNGDIASALDIYSTISRLDREDPEARYMCGVLNAEMGSTAQAAKYLGDTLTLDPCHGPAHFALAGLLVAGGDFHGALASCLEATRLEPENSSAWLMLAGIHGQTGSFGLAEEAARRAIKLLPESAQAFINLGNSLREQGKLADAIEAFQTALDIGGDEPQVVVAMGSCHANDGNHELAEACFRRALALDPEQGSTQSLLGNSLAAIGRHEEALDCFKKTLELDPGSAYIEYRIGLLLGEQSNLDEALVHYQQAIELNPELAEAHDAVGTIYRLKGEAEKALQAYRNAIGIKPDFAEAYVNLGDLLQEDGRYPESIAAYEDAIKYTDSDAVKIKLATALPVILSSADEIQEVRNRFRRSVTTLINDCLVVNNPFNEVSRTSFYLAYHGLDDRELHELLARLYEKTTPSLLYTAPHCRLAQTVSNDRQINVGMISSFFYRHTIGTVMKGFVERFSRDRFHVTVFTFPYPSDEVTEYIHTHADRVVILPREWENAHEIIACEQLDILFYTDIGMDPYTYFLSFARLASVQFTTWGHPVTAGVGNIDYYLTCKHFEPENGREHYSEQLVQLSGLPSFYEKPEHPESNNTRQDYGLKVTQHVYLCPQTLYKFHPEFDAILGRILRQDKQGVVVMVDCPHRHWQELLMERFSRQIPDVIDRIVVLHYPGSEEYLHLLTLADVMLDTLHYGGGSTSLQALAFGVPIVTLPGGLQRGRHTYGYYKTMGFTDCVASDTDEYVDIALRLGNDAEYRSTICNRILQLNSVLYENQQFVDEIEEFMETAIRECGAGSGC